MVHLSTSVVGLFAILLILFSACKDDQRAVRGVVIDIQPRSLTEVSLFSVQDFTGKSWTFETDGPIDFMPSHIRDHSLSGKPVTVYYQVDQGRLLVQRITD